MSLNQVKLAENVYADGHIVVAGERHSGKTTLIRKLAKQLVDNGVYVEAYYDKPISDKLNDYEVYVDLIEINNALNNYKKEVEEKLKLLQDGYSKNDLTKFPYKTIIIDDTNNFTRSEDYKFQDSYISKINYLIYYASEVNINLILVYDNSYVDCANIFNPDLMSNINSFIVLGGSLFDSYFYKFNADIMSLTKLYRQFNTNGSSNSILIDKAIIESETYKTINHTTITNGLAVYHNRNDKVNHIFKLDSVC